MAKHTPLGLSRQSSSAEVELAVRIVEGHVTDFDLKAANSAADAAAPTVEASILHMARTLEIYAFDLARSVEPKMIENLLQIALQLEQFHRSMPQMARSMTTRR